MITSFIIHKMDWQETRSALQIRAGGSAISGWRVFHSETGSPALIRTTNLTRF